MKVGFVLTESVDGRFVPWESFLEWESYLDFYCLALRRLGAECIKYVPSIAVRKTTSYKHKFGHIVKRVPVFHPLLNPSWSSRPRAYSHGLTTTSHSLEGLGFSFNLVEEAKQDRIDVLHYASYYSIYYASSAVLQLLWPTAAQYTGGSLPSGVRARLLWKLALIPELRLARTILVGEYPAELRSLETELCQPREKVSRFGAPVVDRSFFREADRDSSARAVGFDPSAINILAVTFIPQAPRDFLAKNPFSMLEVFEYVVKNTSERVALHVVGFGPGLPELGALVRQKGLSSSVFLHGKVEHSELPLYYSASDLVFLPYPLLRLNEGSATAEAFSCGRPVVAFKRTDSTSVEQPGGFLVDVDPAAGGAAIRERIRDSGYLREKGREGLRLSSEFSLENAGAMLAKVYGQMLWR